MVGVGVNQSGGCLHFLCPRKGREDRAFATRLKSELERLGLTVFIDVEGLEGGDEWNSVLDKEVKSAGAVVGLWSNYSLTREWPRKECRAAVQRKVLIPVLIEPVENLDIPLEFEGIQFVSFVEETEEQWQALIRSLSRTLRRPALIDAFAAAANSANVAPLVAESTTVESTNVRVVLDDYGRGRIRIPSYQRDSNQWNYDTKSLFIETIINNLAVPALFFEPLIESGKRIDEVVDGQQRITTLQEFYTGRLRLVSRDDAPYISPNSAHYAGRVFEELPLTFRDSFEAYRLPIIKLHNLGGTRLEVFRRINQGGTPLSAQDIRLAYYGGGSPTLGIIRLAGIHDPSRASNARVINSAKEEFGEDYPWLAASQFIQEHWFSLWGEKEISKGQKASEMFLWSLISAQVDRLNQLLSSRQQLEELRLTYGDSVDEALDAYCAKISFEDHSSNGQRFFVGAEELRDLFFPHFVDCLEQIYSRKTVYVQKSRLVATMIGALYAKHVPASQVTHSQWDQIIAFIENQRAVAKELKIDWPEPRGRWSGPSGTSTQLRRAREVLDRVLEAQTKVS